MHRKQKNEIPRYGNYGKYGKYGNYGSCKRDVEEIVEYEGRGFERIWREEDIAKTFTADLMIQVLGKYKGVEIFFGSMGSSNKSSFNTSSLLNLQSELGRKTMKRANIKNMQQNSRKTIHLIATQKKP